MDMAIVLATFVMDPQVVFLSMFIQQESFLEVLSFLLHFLLLLQQAIEIAKHVPLLPYFVVFSSFLYMNQHFKIFLIIVL